MNKAIISAVMVLVFAATAWAYTGEAEYLIDGFENTTYFGNGGVGGPAFDSMTFTSGVGVTQGTYALMLDMKAGWQQGLSSGGTGGVGWGWSWAFPQLTNARYLRLDVTSSSTLANVPMSGFVEMTVTTEGQSGLYNNGQPWWGNTYSYNSLMSVYSSGPMTETLEWDLSKDMLGNPVDLPPAYSASAPGGNWFSMTINCNVSGVLNPGYIVIDNLRSVKVPQPLLGDFNGDGSVDQADYTIMADNFGQRRWGIYADGSYLADGTISQNDYTSWADNFGKGKPSTLHDPAAGDPQLRYRRTQLANGQWAYDFYMVTADGQLKCIAGALRFAGKDGAAIEQLTYGGTDMNSEGPARAYDGRADYVAAEDSWAYLPFGDNPLVGVSPAGGIFGGFRQDADWYEMAIASGCGSALGNGALVAHVVCDGELTWSGNLARLGLNYSARGLAGAGGDFNGDGVVDQADYTTWADHFGWTGDPANSPLVNDFDGVVDQGDYTTWADTYGQGASAVTVPEPASLALLGLGAVAMLRRRK